LKLTKRTFKKRMKNVRPKRIFRILWLLKVKIREIGKREREKMAKAFGVPMVLKEIDLATSKGKRKIPYICKRFKTPARKLENRKTDIKNRTSDFPSKEFKTKKVNIIKRR